MKKKNKYFLYGILFVAIFAIGLFAFKMNHKKEITYNDLVNISNLSDEFMHDYFEGVEKLQENNNKENILIVTSSKDIKETYGATDVIKAPNNQYFLQYETKEKKEKALNKFKSNHSISVSENVKRELLEDTVLLYNYNSWGVESMGIDTLLTQAKDMKLNNVVVAIVDSGLDVELFNEKYPNRLLATYNVLDSSTDVTDNTGHGTHIAGTIAEATPDSVKILVVKTSNSRNMYTIDNITGINYVTYGKKADVINMSYGGETNVNQEFLAINAAKNAGIIPVAASGNNNSDIPLYPANYSNTISIAAVDSNKEKASFSNYGDSIMFSAPGVNILSINGTESGTSMATPHAVSAVAILKSMNSELKYTDVVTLLRRYSEDLGTSGWDEYYGYGFINFSEANLCNNIKCDEYNVFTQSDNDELVELVENYEIIPVLTEYNYFNNTNIMETIVRLNYKNGKVIEYRLNQVDDLIISDYDYNTTNEQTINIDLTTPLGYRITDSFTVSNPSNYETVWKYNVLDENSVEITGLKDNTSYVKTLVIPEQLDGYNVVAIADGDNTVFADSWNLFKNVENLYLPATLTKIGKNAFYNKNLIRTNLNYVKSEADNIEIMDNAFRTSEALLTIDANISYIGDYAFYFTASLSEINFASDLNHIGDYAFYGSFSEFTNTKIVIPNSVNEFGESVFMNSSINEVEFLNDMEILPENTFKNSDVEKVIFNNNVIEIDTNAFQNCTKLKELNLPSSLTIIDSSAFERAFDDAIIVIPENVATIGLSAFKNSGLKAISFPNSNLQEIGNFAFAGSAKLENITIPSSVTNLGTDVFSASGLKKVVLNANVEEIPSRTFKGSNLLEEIIISDNVNTIGDYAFEGCKKLKNINLTDNLLKIGFRAFSKAFDSKEDLTLEFPKSVVYIGNSAFYESGLKKAVLNDNKKKIPNSLFQDSNLLEEVTISNNVTTIGDYAFSGCNKLKNINLTNNLLEIGKYAFSAAFDNKENIKLKIPKNVILLGDSAFDSAYIKEVEFLTDNLETISKNAFSNSTTLEKVTLSENIKNIGEKAFCNNSNLNSVYLNRDLENISENAFEWKYLDVNTHPHLIFYVYSNSVGKTYASNKSEDNESYTISYVQINPDKVTVKNLKDNYYAFENADDISLELTYNEENIRTETITDNIEIQYQNGSDGFRYGDTSFKITIYNSNNYKIEQNIDISISKAIPQYTIPNGLVAEKGQILSAIMLPERFEWMNSTQEITEEGTHTFKARYTPSDTDNYEIVENINIPISVSNAKNIIIPNIQIFNKTYDGTTSIDLSSITISNLNDDEYTIQSATLANTDVGNTTATIVIRLSDDKFNNYMFEDGSKEKEFTTSVKIVPQKLTIPTKIEKTYKYNGEEQTILLNNFDSNKMNIVGNKRTNAGQQDVVISLKNSNYIWCDNTSGDITFDFKINKAEIEIQDNTLNETFTYDNLPHTLNLNLNTNDAFIIKYMDNNEEYTLSDCPSYINVGIHTIKYKVYINNNYTEYFGQKTLTIEDKVLYVINKYDVDETNKYISKIIVNTEVNNFTSNITLGYGYGIDVDTKEIHSKRVLYTGGKTRITQGINLYREYTNIVIGDINGDGSINSADLLKIRQHLLGTNILSGAYFLSSDINYDNTINSADLLRVRQHLLGTKPIE